MVHHIYRKNHILLARNTGFRNVTLRWNFIHNRSCTVRIRQKTQIFPFCLSSFCCFRQPPALFVYSLLCNPIKLYRVLPKAKHGKALFFMLKLPTTHKSETQSIVFQMRSSFESADFCLDKAKICRNTGLFQRSLTKQKQKYTFQNLIVCC